MGLIFLLFYKRFLAAENLSLSMKTLQFTEMDF